MFCLLYLKMTPPKQRHIYHAVVKSTIAYAAETWCLKAKMVTKPNSTEMDFWRRSARLFRKDKIRDTIIKQKMNVTRSLLDDINTKTTEMVWTCSENGRGKTPKTGYEMEPTRTKETR